MFIEQGPIRPPSEAGSLLIRVTRNCPWNRCVCGRRDTSKRRVQCALLLSNLTPLHFGVY
ncbi:hypothetical protein SAMN05660706_1012 [Desulfoscipio geothermicus DSM 3669]|uniref:Uncharacterized protein n=1 Tax=Desulfoscipio geothermicus DSM 3669 TaxID=1121426 RepID=A0A1I6CN47_9FIRM|nr:hypothetical protein SAMN05660706_1012 [Desulfoscipio geothermicus DSM 3669]